MKAIAYNIKPEEKEWLIVANYKKHDITIIANSLNEDTLAFAKGKEALIIFNEDILNSDLINGLKSIGIKYITTSAFDTEHIDLIAAKAAELKIANVPFKDGEGALKAMHQVIKNLDNWAAGKCVGKACCSNHCTVADVKKEN